MASKNFSTLYVLFSRFPSNPATLSSSSTQPIGIKRVQISALLFILQSAFVQDSPALNSTPCQSSVIIAVQFQYTSQSVFRINSPDPIILIEMASIPSPAATEVLTSPGGKSIKRLPPIIKKKPKKQQLDNYSRYIHRVLQQAHPTLGISSKAMSIVNSFMLDMFERLASEAARLRKRRGVSVITGRDIQTATKLVLSGELAHHAVSEGTKAVALYFGGELKANRRRKQDK